MNVGVGLPTTTPGATGELLLDWARRADAGPFSSVAVLDRVAYDSFEPFAALAAAAGVTERVRLATMIAIGPLRPTGLLAKQAASVHQLSGGRLTLGLAVGARTMKMHQGHHGANHPVKDLTTGKVEITSMNHGFAVDGTSLPARAQETHVSLFDGSNCGTALSDRPVFSVQYHPEASPGPRDSHYLFARFTELMRAAKR